MEISTFKGSIGQTEFEKNSGGGQVADLKEYQKLTAEELRERIMRARKAKNAVLLVHNYQPLEIQEFADYLGDSLGLSIEATKTETSLIVFCGVDFMAESAKILNPEKKVVIPDRRADCPMAKMVDIEELRELKKRYPGAVVVTYVNSTADVKAESDICCTSANAVQVVRSLVDKKIIFTPDKNLALYTKKMTGADIIPWEGFCYVHDAFGDRDVEEALNAHPGAVFIAHPECTMEVLDRADLVTSTSGMVKWVDGNLDTIDKRGVIIGTEVGLVNQLRKKYPSREIHPLFDRGICKTQKLTNLPNLCWALENEQYEVNVPEDIRVKAYSALKRMIDILPQD